MHNLSDLLNYRNKGNFINFKEKKKISFPYILKSKGNKIDKFRNIKLLC